MSFGLLRAAFSGLCASLVASCVMVADREPVALAIRGVTIISPERAAPLANVDVLVDDGRIIAIERSSRRRATQEIDGSGRFLTPGLIDSHVHLYHATGLKRRYTQSFDELYAAYQVQQPRSYLYFGYTTVVELNADFETNQAFEGAPLHPDLFHCGQGLVLSNDFMATDFGSQAEFLEAFPSFLHDRFTTPELPDGFNPTEHTPAAAVAQIAANGGRCVKLYYEAALWWPTEPRPAFALPSEAIVREVAAEAHARGMPLILHATSANGFRLGMRGGVDIFAHGPWDWPGVAYDDPEIPADASALIEELARERIAVQPTMRTLRNTASLFDPGSLTDPALSDVLPAPLLTYLQTDAQSQRDDFLRVFGTALAPDADESEVATLQIAFNRRYERLIGMMDHAGVPLLFGTDTAVGGFGWGNPPGLNGYWEMQGWVRGGVSLRSLFEAATLRNAVTFGLDDEIGSVEIGKRANLLILEGNPSSDVTAYDSITHVIVGGRVIERGALSARAVPEPRN